MEWLAFFDPLLSRQLRLIFPIFYVYLASYDYKKRKPFGFLYGLYAIFNILFVVMGLGGTILMGIGSFNAFFDHRGLVPFVPILFLFLAVDIVLYFHLRRFIRITQYYRTVKRTNN